MTHSTAALQTLPDDRGRLPDPEDQLKWTVEDKIVGHRNMNAIFASTPVAAGGVPFPLPEGQPVEVSYTYDGATRGVDDFFKRTNATGLLVIKDGQVVLEQYDRGYTVETVGSSRSMAKSFTGLLVGLAIKDGHIGDIDDRIPTYLPELAETMYADVSIRQLLQMTSGVPYLEDPLDPASDLHRLHACMVKRQRDCLLPVLKDLGSRPVPPDEPGSIFRYSTADAVLAGILVERATGEPAAAYLSRRVWIPFGMETDAYWSVEAVGGHVFGGSGFGATLRDYGRLGLYFLRHGVLPDGSETLPAGWMRQALTPSPASIRAGFPYGFHLWLHEGNGAEGTGLAVDAAIGAPWPLSMPGGNSTFYARGNSGQVLLMNPAERIVIAKWSAWDNDIAECLLTNEDMVFFSAIACALEGHSSTRR
jgi:CubicO group peptidase (beta-lactamase class C family)